MKIVTVLMLLPGYSALAASAIPQGKSLLMVVGDHVGLGGSTVEKAAELAHRILYEAGVPMEATTCSIANSEEVSFYPCLSGSTAPDLVLRILPKAVPGLPVPRVSMGVAVPGKPAEPGAHAYLFYDRVQRAAEFCKCDALRILGHAIAHEIGHLLGVEHSTSGIMSADWDMRTLVHMSRGHVLFNRDEARRMQENVAAMMLQRALAAGRSSSGPAPVSPGNR